MKHILTFIAYGMDGAIDVDYVWVCEEYDGMWVSHSMDIDFISVIAPTAIKRDRQIAEVIKSIWLQSNVYVSVRKIASSSVVENAR